MKKVLVGVIVLSVAILIFIKLNAGSSNRSVPGIPAPIQTAATGGTSFEEGGYKITLDYKAAYTIEALVLSSRKYSPIDIDGKLMPKDVALGWGTVAEYNDRINFHWRQSGRWYFWQVNSYAELSPVGNESDVGRQSANNHLVPSNDEIRKQIAKIKTGDHVIITGYLVDIRAQKDNGDYKIWKTSTSREDVGGGSCEIIYVTGIQIL